MTTDQKVVGSTPTRRAKYFIYMASIKHKKVGDNLIITTCEETQISLTIIYDGKDSVIYKEFLGIVGVTPNTFFKSEKNMNLHEMYYAYLIKKFLNITGISVIVSVLQLSKNVSPICLVVAAYATLLNLNLEFLCFNPNTNQPTYIFENNIFAIMTNGCFSALYYTGSEISLNEFFAYCKKTMSSVEPKYVAVNISLKNKKLKPLESEVLNKNSLIMSNDMNSIYINRLKLTAPQQYDFSQSGLLDRNNPYKSYINIHYKYDEQDNILSRRIHDIIAQALIHTQSRFTVNVLTIQQNLILYIVKSILAMIDVKKYFIYSGFLYFDDIGFKLISNAQINEMLEYEINLFGKDDKISHISIMPQMRFNLISLSVLKNIVKKGLSKKEIIDGHGFTLYTKNIPLSQIEDLNVLLESLKNTSNITYILNKDYIILESYKQYDLHRFANDHVKTEFDARVIQELESGFLIEFNNKQNTGILYFKDILHYKITVGQKIKIVKIKDTIVLKRERVNFY